MPTFAQVVHDVTQSSSNGSASADLSSSPRAPLKGRIDISGSRHRSSQSYNDSAVTTPAERTGPPRSLSYNYSLPASPVLPTRSSSRHDHGVQEVPRIRISTEGDGEKYSYDFTPRESEFRGALEYTDPEQRERERELAERKGKRRDTRLWDELKMKIHDSFVESPKDDKAQSDNLSKDEGAKTDNDNEEGPSRRLSS